MSDKHTIEMIGQVRGLNMDEVREEIAGNAGEKPGSVAN